MTTVTVVKKGDQVAIAADTLVTFGDTRLLHGYEVNEKIFAVGDSFIGMSGTTAHFPVLRKALGGMPPAELRLHSREDVFETFLKLHPRLKDHFFLNTKEEDADPYESSQFTILIANASGIYAVYSYREVFQFDKFWAIGSGRSFALGAMYAAYDGRKSAKDIAELGVRAGCEFDKNSYGPVKTQAVSLNKT
jgi:ATP-dependent protease HslVU (ClpYQ) peptidase subunit